jgi:branched-chain amino acid transport system substrate-binding protein
MHHLTRLVPGVRRWPVLIALLALLVAAGGPALAAHPLAQAGVLRIGYLGVAGSDLYKGAQLAIDQINGAGGFQVTERGTVQLELVPLAAPPTADSLAADANALIAQGVVALLGPDESSTLTEDTVQALTTAGLPVLTAATADTLTGDDATNTLLRIRAPERLYSQALAAVLLDDLGLTSFALVQTNLESTEALLAFESVLTGRGIAPGARVQLADSAGLLGESRNLLDLNPEAVVMWGAPQDAANLLSLLRKGGWTGQFVYRQAEEAVRAGVLSKALAAGVIGASNWSYAHPGRASRIFLEDYLLAYGQVPGPLAAAGYDAIWALRAALIAGGTAPEALAAALVGAEPRNLVGGTLRPADFGDGDMIRVVMVYRLSAGGAPTLLARFDDGQPVAIEETGG